MKESLRLKQLHKKVSDIFIFWAEEYFTEEHINLYIRWSDAYENYKETMFCHDAFANRIIYFQKCVKVYCEYRGWELNPKDIGEIPEGLFYIKKPIAKKAILFQPSEVGINPGFDTMLAAMLNGRFNGFLECLANNLGIELETMVTVSRTILAAADIKQDK